MGRYLDYFWCNVQKSKTFSFNAILRALAVSDLGTVRQSGREQGRRFLVDDGGQAAMVIVIFIGLFVLGFLALGLDVGYLFHQKRMAQAAADAAAVAAAEEANAGNNSNEQTVANAMAKMNGFDPAASVNAATVTLKTPTTGNYSGSASFIEADVSKLIPTFFLSSFNRSASSMKVSARAVAGGGLSSPTCICLEAPTGQGLTMSNNGQINATQCGVTVDSSSSNAVGIVGSATLNSLSLGTVSNTWNSASNLGNNVNNNGQIASSKIVAGITTQCKPVLTVPTLPVGITCYDNPVQGYTVSTGYTGNYTLPVAGETATSNTLCFKSLNTSNARSVTFTPGYTYYIQGDLTTGGGAPISGSNMQLYVGGNVNFTNSATATLSAPTVSGVPQTLIYAMGNTVSIQGGTNSNLSGLVYAPNAAVTLNNGTGTTLTMDFVAQTLSISGGAALNSYSISSLGTLNLSVAKLVE
ncbi:MAG TPA: pilus assembly protein TadG-related protein [Terracidiphilus sp.]|nr:pilus assembly protein TadG-related protein [Terracidiphilus sp.]